MEIKELFVQYPQFNELYSQYKFIIGYDDGSNVILHFRDGSNAKCILTISGFPWYFCISKKDFDNNKELFDDLITMQKIDNLEEEGLFMKIYCSNMNNKYLMDNKTIIVAQCKEHNIQTYEADLNSYQRFVIDHNLEISDTYAPLYFDIETDDRGNGIEIGRDQIVSISAINKDGKVYYKSCTEESDLLKWFKELMVKYDVIAGWNSENFDIPYLKARFKKNKISFNWRSICQVDLMKKTIGLNKKNAELIKEVRSFSLNSVAKHFLNESKVEHSETIWELFTQKPEKLKEYNIQDAMLLLKIDNKLHLIQQQIIESRITGSFINEFSVSRVLDTYILRQAAKSKPRVRFITRPEKTAESFDSNRESAYTGGLVLEPVSGIHKRVYHFDFTSLYPSIIKSFNISPETLLPDDYQGDCIQAPNGAKFSRETGIIPKIIVSLLDARNKIRKGELKKYKEGTPEYENLYYQQYAFKTMANSFYGILGASFTRYFKIKNAEAITLSGHYLITCVKLFCEFKNCLVIYGDTDSVFVVPPDDFNQTADEFDEELNLFLQYHLFKMFGIYESSIINIKTEAVYEKMMLWGRKKKYAKIEDGKIKYMGIEAKRRETLPFAAKLQIEMFEKLLKEEYTGEQMFNWVSGIKEEILNGKLGQDDLVLQVKLSKGLDEYRKKVKNEFGEVISYQPSKLVHVKVANWLKEHAITQEGRNSWEKGEYVKFIVTKGYGGVEGCSVYNYQKGIEDRTYYWNTKIYAILERILLEIFPELDWKSLEIDTKKPRVKKTKKTDKLTNLLKEL